MQRTIPLWQLRQVWHGPHNSGIQMHTRHSIAEAVTRIEAAQEELSNVNTAIAQALHTMLQERSTRLTLKRAYTQERAANKMFEDVTEYRLENTVIA